MSRNCTYLVIAATLASLTGISEAVAFENWPSSVVGTWNATANQSGLTLNIFTQGPGPGQPNGVKCPEITGNTVGSAGDIENLVGSYCPDSGRIVFSRIPPAPHLTQVFSANLSEIPPLGGTLYMGGLFETQGGGEYSFFAHKP